MLQLASGMQNGCEPRKDIDRVLKETDNTREWFPNYMDSCQQDLGVNQYLGARGAMSLGRIQDPEGRQNPSGLLQYNSRSIRNDI